MNATEPGEVTKELRGEQGDFFGHSASLRLQLFQASEACITLGLKPYALSLSSKKPDQLNLVGIPNVCIIGKLVTHQEMNYAVQMANLAAISRLKLNRIPIIVTYSDNWCDALKTWNLDPNDTNLIQTIASIQLFYRELLSIADSVILPSNAIADLASRWVNNKSNIKVIEDPTQVSRRQYRHLDSESECRILWFGHPSNVKFLLDQVPSILKACKAAPSFELSILSSDYSCRRVLSLFNRLSPAKPWKLRLVNWNTESWDSTQLEFELARAHIVIIPSDLDNPRKSCAGHNRVVDSIQSGCLVIATPLQSYKELSQCTLLGDDFPALIDECVVNYNTLRKNYVVVRDQLLFPFSKAVNIKKWRDVISLSLGN